MTDEDQKRFILLTALIALGDHATKAESLDFIKAKGLMRLSRADEEIMLSRDEPVWRNNVAFVRKHLVEMGAISGAVRGVWAITPNGKSYHGALLRRIRKGISYDRITDKAIDFAESF